MNMSILWDSFYDIVYAEENIQNDGVGICPSILIYLLAQEAFQRDLFGLDMNRWPMWRWMPLHATV